MAKKKVYAVKVGRQTGLFNTWAECEAQVKGFMGAKFKGFMTAQEAMAWLAGEETPASSRKPPATYSGVSCNGTETLQVHRS